MPLRVDIASGETTLQRTDLRLPGALPLVLSRTYRSGAAASILGPGWRHSLDRSIQIEAERIVYRDGSGRETVFAPVPVGIEAKHTGGLTLQHHAEDYVVYASPLWQEAFSKRGATGPVLALTKIEDGNGNRIQLAYSGGRLSEVTDAAGRRVRFGYTGAHVTQLVLAGSGFTQPVRSFRYGAGGTLVAETDASGATTEYAYQDGLLIRTTDPNGAVWHAQYDAARRCVAIWTADGTVVRHLAYDELRQTTRAVGTDGEQILYRHLLGHQVIEAIDTDGESANFYYDEGQRLIGYALADGTVQSFRRLDPGAGTLFQISGEKRFAEATLGSSGLVETVADAFENTYGLGYDERFNLTSLTTPLGGVWKVERDRQSRVASIESPTGQVARLQHDGAVVRLLHGDQMIGAITSDAFGRIVKRTDGLGRETNVQYDPEGRVTAVECGAYRLALSYDRAGRLIRLADSDRRDTRWQRDVAGRVVAVERAGQGALRFGYDLTGRLAEANGNGMALRFSYDAQDRLRTAHSPSGNTTLVYQDATVAIRTDETTEVYDVFGNLVERQTPGGVTTYQHDPRGALLVVESPEQDAALIEYDADGRLDRYERGDDTLVFAHDADGLLVALEDGRGHHAILEYDTRKHPAMVRMGETAFRLECDAVGKLTALHAPDGTPCRIDYDDLGRVVAITHGADRHLPHGEGASVLRLFEAAGAGEGTGALGVVATRSGLVLVAWLGILAVPLWIRAEARCPFPNSTDRTVQALAHGLERAVDTTPSDEDLLGWVQRCSQPLDTDVPTPEQIGLGWAPLALFALGKAFYAPHFLTRTQSTSPNTLGDEDERGRSAGLTGSHRSLFAHPQIWSPRGRAPVRPAAPVLLDGGLTPERALRLFHTLTTLAPA